MSDTIPKWAPKPPKAVTEASRTVTEAAAATRETAGRSAAARNALNATPDRNMAGGERRIAAQGVLEQAEREHAEATRAVERAERAMFGAFTDSAAEWAPRVDGEITAVAETADRLVAELGEQLDALGRLRGLLTALEIEDMRAMNRDVQLSPRFLGSAIVGQTVGTDDLPGLLEVISAAVDSARTMTRAQAKVRATNDRKAQAERKARLDATPGYRSARTLLYGGG